jgi:hypothetical protein
LFLPFVCVGAITAISRAGFLGDPPIAPSAGSALLAVMLLASARLARRSVRGNDFSVPAQPGQAVGGLLTFAVLAWIISPPGARPALATAVLAFGIPAAAEELVFRYVLPGLVYHELVKATRRPLASAWLAVMTTQVCFGLSHVWSIRWSIHSPAAIASLIGSGLALFTIARTAGLGAAVAIHACLNWSTVNRFPEQGRFATPVTVALWFGLALVAATAAAVTPFRSPPLTQGESE